MSATQPGTREIARGIAVAIRPALAAGAPALALVAARDVAQLMGLVGLDAALAQLARHTDARRPVEIDHLAERIARLADAVERDGEVTRFVDEDSELGALAAQLAATDWSPPAPEGGRMSATIEASETLGAWLGGAPEDVRRSTLTVAVASALHAALEWLGRAGTPRVTATVQDSALTLVLAGVHAGGIGPAGAVLASVDGSLGPEASGGWSLRVPRVVERPSYLLLRQGRFGVALPWHSVARLRMFGPRDFARLEEPRLEPLSRLAATDAERPAALVALGLTRAWFVADRIVWRIAAMPREADGAPLPGVAQMVEMEGGEGYWVLDPHALLRGVAPIDAPPPSLPEHPPVKLAPALALAPASAEAAAGPGIEPSPEPSFEPEPPAPAAEAAPAEPVTEPAPAGAPAAETATPVSAADLAAAAERALAQLRVQRERIEARAARPAAPARRVGAKQPPPPPAPAMFAAQIDVLKPEAAGPPPAPHAPAPAAHAAVRPAPSAPPAPAGRRALVVDDSLVARVFLGRLLEKRGWFVESVADAAGMWRELARGPWDLVCADIALPDAHGEPHVRRLLDHLVHAAPASACIVLTRDHDDERAARAAGASQVLRKPFDPEQLHRLLPH